MSSSSNRYRTIDTKIRGDARFRALSAPPPSARELWLHLIACGHDRSIPGLLVVGAGGLADDLEWEISDVRRCFAEIEAQGMAIADWTARVIWVPKAVAPGRNEPRSPDNVTAIGSREWGDVPECELKWRAYRAFVDYCATRGEKFLDAAIVTFPAPEAERLYAESLRKVAHPKGGAMGATKVGPKGRSRVAPSQQEGPTPLSLSPSPSLERYDPPYPPTTGGSVALDAVAVDAPEPTAGLAAVVEAWNEGVGSSGVRRAATPSKATAKRDAQLRAAMKRHPEPEAWRWCGRALSLSRHHCGGNDTGWVAALEWLLGRGGGAKLDEWMQRGAELRARGGRPPVSPVLITPPPSAAGQRLNAVLDHLHDIGARLEPERERDPPMQGRLAIPPLTRGYVRREEMPS